MTLARHNIPHLHTQSNRPPNQRLVYRHDHLRDSHKYFNHLGLLNNYITSLAFWTTHKYKNSAAKEMSNNPSSIRHHSKNIYPIVLLLVPARHSFHAQQHIHALHQVGQHSPLRSECIGQKKERVQQIIWNPHPQVARVT